MGTAQAFMGNWSPAISLAQTVPRNEVLPHLPIGCAGHDAKLKGLTSLLSSGKWISELAFFSLDRAGSLHMAMPYGKVLRQSGDKGS